jgi:ribosomal protein S18 acetylase RimI-like enzyme
MADLHMVHPGPLPARVRQSRDPAVRLRAADVADAPALGSLLQESFPDWGWTTERARAELIDGPSIRRVWLAHRGDAVIGTASERIVEKDGSKQGEVFWVGVSPASRGLGVGALVTSAVLAGFAEAGLSRALLDTQDDKAVAIGMYLQFGFIPSPRSEAEEVMWSQLVSAITSRRDRPSGQASAASGQAAAGAGPGAA